MIRPALLLSRTLSLALVISGAPAAFAQNGSVKTQVDARRVGVEDVVTFSIVLEGEAASLDAALPALRNLRVVGGPSVSTQISFVNGSMSRQRILSFGLQAEKPGTADIGAVTIQGYPPTAPIALEVVAGAVRPARQPDPFPDPFGGRDPFEELFGRARRREPVAQEKLFVEARLSRTSARVGEPILVTYFVYTQISLRGVEFAEAPKYPGFWAEEVERSRGESSGQNVTVEGEAFLRYPVLERLVFPTRTGTLAIPEARLRLVPAMGVFGVAAPIERSTKRLEVQVGPLPQGATDKSAVGRYEVSASTDRTEVPLGDAVTFRFKVKGLGNIKWIDAAPELAIPGVRIFPPRVISDLTTTRQGIDGTKTWEFVLVPEKAGAFDVPALTFSYFDPQTDALKTEQTPAIPITVTSPAGTVVETARSTTNTVSLRSELDEPQRTASAAALVASLVAAGSQVMARRRRRSAGTGRTFGDPKAAADALQWIRDDAFLQATKERAATRLTEAIESVFGPRDSWPDDETGERLRSLGDDLDFLRYAPQLGTYDTKLREVRDRAIALLESAQ